MRTGNIFAFVMCTIAAAIWSGRCETVAFLIVFSMAFLAGMNLASFIEGEIQRCKP